MAAGSLVRLERFEDVTQAHVLCAQVLEPETIDAIGGQLLDAVGQMDCPRMVVAFDAVEHLSSSALGMLITLNTRIKEAGGGLCLAAIDDRILDVFRITGLDRIFEIQASCEDARDVVRA